MELDTQTPKSKKQLTELIASLSQVMDLMLSNKRMEGESFKDYKERRTFANKMIKKYLNK